MIPAWLRAIGVVVASSLLVLAGCADTPSAPAAAWPQRPVVGLAFDVAPDLRSVAGRETVSLMLGRRVCELVFRAWPNKPSAARAGNQLEVTGAIVDGRHVQPRVLPAGAPDGAPGTLVELPLPQCVPAGEGIRAELDFTLRLGKNADERLGMSPETGTAWFGSGFPLLAWVRGQGWAREDAVDIAGETATSEVFRLNDLTVTVPDGMRVAGTGQAQGERPGPRAGTRTHRFKADAVRDVAVAVGRYEVLERDITGTRLHLFTPVDGTRVEPEQWAGELDRALQRLTGRFGHFPYPDLWVAIAPAQSSGIEFPGALQFGDTRHEDLTGLATHELAHQWFYGLVGGNQARDPWLDEAFASYAEASLGGATDRSYYDLEAIPDRVRGDLGDPMAEWSDRGFGTYYQGVYRQGAAVLLAARAQAGPDRFDAALRDHIARHAHTVTRPTDVAAAFDDLPDVLDLLRRYGALPPAG